jgi:hypothetical protein
MEDPNYGKLTVQTLLEVAAVFDVALSIRFVSFPTFVAQIRDLTEASMQVEGFDQSAFAIASEERKEATLVDAASVLAASRYQSSFNTLREGALLHEKKESERSTARASRAIGGLSRNALSAALPSSTAVKSEKQAEMSDLLSALVAGESFVHLPLPNRSSSRGFDWVRH